MKKVALIIGIVIAFLLCGIVSASQDALGDPLKPSILPDVSSADIRSASVTNAVGGVIQVDSSSLTCPDCADLEALDVPVSPGTNYDGILVSGGLKFAERFTGQTLTYNGNFDVLSGSPTSPLSLQVGSPNQNLNVMDYSIINHNIVTGLGPSGFPVYDAIGEGSVAVLFPSPQSAFKFDVVGSNAGRAVISFFKSDGSSLGTVVIGIVNSQTYGFKTNSGNPEIAGFSIENTDSGGIAYDNICYTLARTNVPEFPSIFLPATMIMGFLGVIVLIRRTKEQ